MVCLENIHFNKSNKKEHRTANSGLTPFFAQDRSNFLFGLGKKNGRKGAIFFYFGMGRLENFSLQSLWKK
jgi:hypothetical protein